MGKRSREARITLGSKSYTLETSLDRSRFSEIEAFCQALYKNLDSDSDHERRLVLGWMLMAYKLQQAEERLSLLLEKYQFSASDSEGEANQK